MRTSCFCGGVLKTTKKTLFGLGMLMLALVCSLDTASAQTITASSTNVIFNTTPGVTPPAQQITIMSSSGVTPVTLSTFGANWLQVTPLSGSTSLVVTLSVGSNAPTTGPSAAGFIVATASNPNALTVNVTLNITGGGTT